MNEKNINKGVRFPIDLLEKVEKSAEVNGRTFSQEVIFICKEAFNLRPGMNENTALNEEMVREAVKEYLPEYIDQYMESTKANSKDAG